MIFIDHSINIHRIDENVNKHLATKNIANIT